MTFVTYLVHTEPLRMAPSLSIDIDIDFDNVFYFDDSPQRDSADRDFAAGPMSIGDHDQLGTATDLGGKATRYTPGWMCPRAFRIDCC